MEVFTFDKSLQERLVELTEILSRRGSVVPASQIKSEWASYVELVIEPVGWQALWKIPRYTCQDFNVHYPTIVVVQVEHVDCEDLTALAKIVAVQDEIHLPEKYDMPLIELYPTKNQENDVLDIEGTAKCIDQLRFFFNHLWMPWDFDDDDNKDWVVVHLETRLRLFFDLKRNNVDKETADVIRTLTREARDIYTKVCRLEADISDDESDTKCLVDEGKACQLMKLHVRMQQIKTEMDVLENPAMREMLQRNPTSVTSSNEKRRESRGRNIESYFVWQGGSLSDTMAYLTKAQQVLPTDIFMKTTGCMHEALDLSDIGDIILIGNGEYPIRGAGGLENGGTMKGIGDVEETIICANEHTRGPSLFDFSGENVLLEDFTLDLRELQIGVLVRKRVVTMSGCRILASNQSVVKLGVVVLPGGKLIAKNTTFVGLGTGVAIHVDGEAILTNCKFEECVEGIQVLDGSRLTAVNCHLSNFKEYGIRLETQKNLLGNEVKIGDIKLLESISEISIEGCDFKNNQKGDVIVRRRLGAALTGKNDNTV